MYSLLSALLLVMYIGVYVMTTDVVIYMCVCTVVYYLPPFLFRYYILHYSATKE